MKHAYLQTKRAKDLWFAAFYSLKHPQSPHHHLFYFKTQDGLFLNPPRGKTTYERHYKIRNKVDF